MKILVTGGTGMIGTSLKQFLPDAIYIGSRDIDLKNSFATDSFFENMKPDVVIHLAGRVGGIKDNSDFLYDYCVENLRINTNVVDACVKNNVSKLIAMSSTCVYPRVVKEYPIKEEVLHDGYPEFTNFGYAFAKRMMQTQIDTARKQYGFKWSTIYPSNLYGPHDTFDLQKSHVIPALILKFYNAVKDKEPIVDLYGTGKPLRQFTYVDDVSRQIVDFVNTDIFGDFNFANPVNYEIGTIAEIISRIMGFEGKIVYNGKLDGIYRKDISIEKISDSFSLAGFTDILTGLHKTCDWFMKRELSR